MADTRKISNGELNRNRRTASPRRTSVSGGAPSRRKSPARKVLTSHAKQQTVAAKRVKAQQKNAQQVRNARNAKKRKRELEAISNTIRHNFKYMDRGLVITIMILVVFGLVMVLSASAPSASAYQGNPYHFFIRQGIFAVLGFVSMMFISHIDYHIYSKYASKILIASIVLLLMVYLPVIGIERNGARRWIGIGSFSLQPSEVAKIAVIIFFAHYLTRDGERIKQFKKGVLKYLLVLGIVAAILLKEPHLSATVVVGLTAVILMLTAGAKIWHFVALGLCALPALAVIIYKNPYQLKRVTAFLDPFADTSDSGYQIINSLYAIGSGGFFGLGLGMSRQKYLYLPEPQNDFIFAIVCEELGFLGAIMVIVLFAVLIYRGYRVAQDATDTFGSLLATGITSLVAVQVVLNIAVVTSSVPVTGISLPFFSYGGTSLFILMSAMGILLNISRQTISARR